MIMTNKIVAVALITALLGAGLGAVVMHSRDASRAADSAYTQTNSTTPASPVDSTMRDASLTTAADRSMPSAFKTTEEQNAYKIGFADGFQASTGNSAGLIARSNNASQWVPNRSSRSTSSSQRRVYYDYSKPRGRTFWQKHQDKLTMAIGSGAGAGLGGIIGGKKGAGIGALAGLGGSALYTYKLRKRNH